MSATLTRPSSATSRPAVRPAPGPRGNQFLDYQRDAPGLLLRMQQAHGDLVRMRIGPFPVYLVSHPDLVRHVLLDNARNYTRGRFYEGFTAYFGRGLLTTEGGQWRRQRAVAAPLFHPRKLDEMGPVMTATAVELAERWSGEARAGGSVDVVAESMWFTMAVLGRCLFGTDLGRFADRITPAVTTGLDLITQRMNPVNRRQPGWLPTRHNLRLSRSKRTLDGVIDEVIADHRAHPADGSTRGATDDLVTHHLDAATGMTRTLTDAEVRDGLMTTFLAGHETTGTALAWTLYALAVNPAVRRRLEDELDTVLGGRPATLEDLPRLDYTRMVVDEALRLYPPIWTYPRDVVADDEIGGYRIPAGASVFLSPYVTHRHPELWDNPEAFDPDRFTPDAVANRPRHAYFPFGYGQRQCIGKHLALHQLQVAVATVCQRLHFHVVPGRPVSYRARVSLRPERARLGGVPMTVHARERARR